MKRFLLKEDPDTVYLDHKEKARYTEGPNIAFIVFKDNTGKVRLEYSDSRETKDEFASHEEVRTKIRQTFPNYSYTDTLVGGRIWPNENIASTYQSADRVSEYAKIIEKFFAELGLNINQYDWDFQSSNYLKVFPKWQEKIKTSSTKSIDPELLKQINDIILRIHIANPIEKAKLRKQLEQLQLKAGLENADITDIDKVLSDRLAKKLGGASGETVAQMKFRLGLDEVTFENDPNTSKKPSNMPYPKSVNEVEDEKGYWISPDGKLYDVDEGGGHANFAEDFIFNLKSSKDWWEKVKSGEIKHKDIRLDAIELKWVRIRLHSSKRYGIRTKHRHILEVQAKTINPKQKQIISQIIKYKDAESMSSREFEKYEHEFMRRRVMRLRI